MEQDFTWSGWIKPQEGVVSDYICLGVDFDTREIELFKLDKYGKESNKETA